MAPPQKRQLFTFCKIQVHKKSFIGIPFFPKLVFFFFFFLVSFESKNIDVEQHTQIKSGKGNDKKKAFEEKTRQKTKQRERIDEKNFQISYYHVVLFMKQNQTRKKKKERDKKKEPKDSKERKRRRKKEQNKRETEKEEVKKGEAKKG